GLPRRAVMNAPKWRWSVAVAGLLAALALWLGRPAVPAGREAAAPATPRGVAGADLVGTGRCSARACHGSLSPAPQPDPKLTARLPLQRDEYTRWLAHDKHASAYAVLFEERSKRIARNLNIGPAHEAERCLACHTNPLVARKEAAGQWREERSFG